MNKVVPFNQYLRQDAVHDRIVQVLGPSRSPDFISALVGAVTSNSQLSKCDPGSIISAALKSVEFNLPLGLGQVALVPYKSDVQFQIMKRGRVQLALRSGEIVDLEANDVREGELVGVDRLRGVHKFDWIQDDEIREKSKVIGYFAYIRLKSGFEKTVYMTVKQIEAHARKFSQSYRAYLAKKLRQEHCFWANDMRPDMERKTVLLRLLRDWAPSSTTFASQWAESMRVDQAVFKADGSYSYADNPRSDKAVEAEIIDAEADFKAKKAAPKAKPKKKAAPEPEPETEGPTEEEIADFEASETEAAEESGEDYQW